MRAAVILQTLRKSKCLKLDDLYLKRFSSVPSTTISGTNEIDNLAPERSSETETKGETGQRDTISKAMGAYITRAKEHQEFIDEAEREFVFGRRHLANIMGKDPETFTQRDIDEAIRYLFPSGLYEPKARPMMRPPQEVYPKQKAAQFDMSGRPHHPFFYTNKPNFFYLMHEMVGKINALHKIAVLVTSEGETREETENVLGGSIWINKSELEHRLMEKLSDSQYSEWISCLERMVSHPARNKELAFIKMYRKPLSKQNILGELPPVSIEPDGSKTVHVEVCMRKTARGEVSMKIPGTGVFNINGKGLEFFQTMQSREQIIFPLQMANMLGKVDIVASVQNSGESSQAGCIRWGIGQCVAALGADLEKLRLAGLLTRDLRKRERNKPGQDGARAKWTWKKR